MVVKQPKFTRVEEPTLLWNQVRQPVRASLSGGIIRSERRIHGRTEDPPEDGTSARGPLVGAGTFGESSLLPLSAALPHRARSGRILLHSHQVRQPVRASLSGGIIRSERRIHGRTEDPPEDGTSARGPLVGAGTFGESSLLPLSAALPHRARSGRILLHSHQSRRKAL